MFGQAFKNLGNVDSRTVSVSNGVTLSKVIYPQSQKLRILPGIDIQHDSRIITPKINLNVDRRSILQEPEGRSNEKRILINVNTNKFPFQGASTDECKLKSSHNCMCYPYSKNEETIRYGCEGEGEGEKIITVKKPVGTIITTTTPPPPSRGVIGTLLYWIFG